ncbi:MAG: hypothetical protein M0024_01335 [Nitrospiraceae bacterium]|nr:hypothetical protein [Nitrospiraceae bacterium]
MQQVKRFSEFADKDSLPLDGAKMRLDEIINKEITVVGLKVRTSRFKKDGSPKCLTLQFEIDGQRYVLFTGSTVLTEQMEKYKAEIPFMATIKKIDRYYTFS